MLHSSQQESAGIGWRLFLCVLAALAAGILIRYAVYCWVEEPDDFCSYIQALCVWDCGWYRSIAENGYDLRPGQALRPGAANWAFFPLSPMVAGLFSRITTVPVVVGGFLLSNIYAAAAAIAARPLFSANTRAYWLFVVMLLIGPFSVLFSSLHTEALFILLSTLTFAALRRGKPLEAGAITAALSATRMTGVLMAAAIGVAAVERSLRAGVKVRDLVRHLLADRKLLLGLAIAPIGLILYMAYLRLHMGDGLAFLHIQRAWGRSLGNPFDSLAVLFQLQFPLSPDTMVVGTWAAAGVIGLALSLALAIKGRWPEAVFCTLCIVVSLAGGATSMVRFVAGLVPLGIVAAELLSGSALLYVASFPLAIAAGVFITMGWLNSSMFVM